MGILEARELEGIKTVMDELAVHLEETDMTLDSDAVSGILRCILAGHTSDSIIVDFSLEDDSDV